MDLEKFIATYGPFVGLVLLAAAIVFQGFFAEMSKDLWALTKTTWQKNWERYVPMALLGVLVLISYFGTKAFQGDGPATMKDLRLVFGLATLFASVLLLAGTFMLRQLTIASIANIKTLTEVIDRIVNIMVASHLDLRTASNRIEAEMNSEARSQRSPPQDRSETS